MGSLRFYGGTNLGGKPRLSYINLVSEPKPDLPFQQPKSRLTSHTHIHHQQTNQPPDMPLLKYLPHEICKPKQPKSLPHEICKPTPAIRVYPAAPHEFFIPKPTVKPTTPPKPVTLIRAQLWGLPPDRKKKKKKKFQIFHNFTPPDQKQRQKRVESPPSKPPIPSTEWRYHTTCRRHAITFAPTMSLHEFWDLTH